MTRQQRRRTERQAQKAKRLAETRATALQMLAAMAEADWSVSGATLILPDGTIEYLDAERMRRGGNA